MKVLEQLQADLTRALTGYAPDPQSAAALVKAVQDPKHGDYQANCAMSLAKVLGRPPRQVAEDIVARLDLGDWLEPPQVAGPGFVNLSVRADWLAGQVQRMAGDDRLGVQQVASPRTCVIDYSSPNVAKPMHVGHLRSTIIGDALTRLLRFLGHRVVTDNHLGDWGTQFGILLYGYKNHLDAEAFRTDPVRELGRLYVHVRGLMGKVKSPDGEDEEDTSDPVMAACREETAKLHAGDEQNVRLWQQFMPHCYAELDAMYRRLGVQFDHTLGESFYHPLLAEVVESLQEKGLARRSEGALAIFLDEEKPPALVQKRDGAYTYTTTDLATIWYRMREWQPDAILYVVDFRQTQHFQYLFEIARRWGFDRVQLEHVSFGSVLGPDRKPIKTREGGGTTLEALLDEGVAAAARAYEASCAERRAAGDEVPDLTEAETCQIAEVVGLGAIKYADLSQNRTSDYIFSWDKMLAMNGNTATYMQYAYARIRSILRKGEVDEARFREALPRAIIEKPEERLLALSLLRLEDALSAAAADLKPNLITGYLWDLAKSFNGFYQVCKVLKAETPQLRESRLLLCDLTSRVIRKGLELLGIATAERM